MADSRNANKPNKPDKNEVWSWVVIALLFAFAWPVGLIVLLAKLSDGKRKRPSSGAQPTIITAETENTVKSVAAAEKTSGSAAGQTKKNKSNITRRTPKVSDSGAKVLRIIGIIVTIIGAIALSGSLKENLFFLQDGHWAWFLEEVFFPMGLTAGGLGLLLGSHWMRRRLRRYAKYQTIAGKKETVSISQFAAAADVSPRRVENDLEQMVQKGYWGKEAYLDLSRGVLVCTFEAAEDLEEQAQVKAQSAPAETAEGYSGQLLSLIHI